MEGAKYFRDYQHNYLILKCGETEAGESYQSRMLASGKIERMLKCSVRYINGEAYFYYDISSRVTLENLYRGKKMSCEQVRDLFRQMDAIYRTLEEFFMEEAGLMIRPDSIYYDLSSAKYLGLYYPGKNMITENPYEPLMDFLLSHADSGDRKLTELLYRIYEMSGECFFSMSEALSLFEALEEESPAAENIMERCTQMRAGEGQKYDAENNEAKMNEISGPAEEEHERYDPVPDTWEACGEKEIPHFYRKRNAIFYSVFAGLSLCASGAAVWIYLYFSLTQEETLLLMCCLGVMGLCFLFSVIQLFLSGKKEKKKEQEEKALMWEIEDEFREERPVAIQDVLKHGPEIQEEGRGREKGRREEREEVQYGETVFFDRRKQEAEYKLYSLDRNNKKHIDLTRFPFSIGKMPGCVDCVLTDDSVSRLHARLEKQGEKILLTDMNSTNGTYKNGLRMEPSETVEIEPGDEIRFGKLNYCYR